MIPRKLIDRRGVHLPISIGIVFAMTILYRILSKSHAGSIALDVIMGVCLVAVSGVFLFLGFVSLKKKRL
jgi:hypothetical protein